MKLKKILLIRPMRDLVLFPGFMKKQKDITAKLERQIQYFSFVSGYARIALIAERLTQESDEAAPDNDTLLNIVLEPISHHCGKLFGCEADEWWNFAVYVMDERDGVLKPIWRRKHLAHPSQQGLGRGWPSGVGHVGRAFADNEDKITSDASPPAVQEQVRPPVALRRDYDERAYVSFAALPVRRSVHHDAPCGVLVGTSNKSGRFDRENCEILRQAAIVVGCVLRSRESAKAGVLGLR